MGILDIPSNPNSYASLGSLYGSSTRAALASLPTSFTGVANDPGLIADYNADVLTGTDGSSVTSWADAKATGALTQATAANQPLLKLKALNGHNAVRFTGGSYWMRISGVTSQSQFTTVLVARFGGNSINKYMFDSTANVSTGTNLIAGGAGQVRAGGKDFAAATGGGWAVWRLVSSQNAGTLTVYRNGVLVGYIASGASTALTEITLGAQGGGAPAYFGDGDIARVLVFNRAMTPEDGIGVDRELGGAYGIPVTESGVAPTQVRVRYDSIVMSDGNKASFAIPESYVPGRPTPLLLIDHGNGSNEGILFTIGTGTPQSSMTTTEAALALGFIVATSDGGGTAVIGNSTQRAAGTTLLNYLKANYTIGPIVLAGQSAGGLASLKRILVDKVPNVVGWCGFYPATDLTVAADGWATGQSLIGTAYGVVSPYNSSASNFASVASVEDPMKYPVSAFGSKRYRAYASSGDTTTYKTQNADTLIAKLNGAGSTVREATVVSCTGGHGDPSHFQPRDFMAFLIRCISDYQSK